MARVIANCTGLVVVVGGYSFGAATPTRTATKPIEVFQGDIVELKIPGRGCGRRGTYGKDDHSFLLKDEGAFLHGPRGRSDLEAKPGLVKVIVKVHDDDGDAARQPSL